MWSNGSDVQFNLLFKTIYKPIYSKAKLAAAFIRQNIFGVASHSNIGINSKSNLKLYVKQFF